MTEPKIERTRVNPSMVRSYLERAVTALRDGDVAAGRTCVETVLTKLVIAQAGENTVLD
jgi:hypothetical protein